MNILERIIETKHTEIRAAAHVESFEKLYHRAAQVAREAVSLSGALGAPGPSIIAEFKRKSPSKGFIHEGAQVVPIVMGYAGAGAAAISVLTDSDYFGGSLDDLTVARRAVSLPLLRKDFIIDPYQICQARIAGADAILLIAAAMEPGHCASLAGFARKLGLEVLLELHDPSELGHINPHINVVGVNNRNLGTFATDTAISLAMAPMLPRGMVRISESGISSPETIAELHRAGYDGFLIGETFMKHPDPAAALMEFTARLSQTEQR